MILANDQSSSNDVENGRISELKTLGRIQYGNFIGEWITEAAPEVRNRYLNGETLNLVLNAINDELKNFQFVGTEAELDNWKEAKSAVQRLTAVISVSPYEIRNYLYLLQMLRAAGTTSRPMSAQLKGLEQRILLHVDVLSQAADMYIVTSEAQKNEALLLNVTDSRPTPAVTDQAKR